MSASVVLQTLSTMAASRPRDLAIVVDGGDDLDFGDWDRRSGALASGLAARGTAPGDRVALRFDTSGWAAFATAYAGVLKAGAVAVLIPAGLADVDAARILRHSKATAILGPPSLTQLSPTVWAAEPAKVEEDGGAVPLASATNIAVPSEVVYLLAPMAWPQSLVRAFQRDLAIEPWTEQTGWLVHAWAPGSLGGQHALAQVLGGGAIGIGTLHPFTAGRLHRLVARLGATMCGLPAGLAAALGATGASKSPLPSVTTVVRSPPSPTFVSLSATFPNARTLDVPGGGDVPDGPHPSDAAPAAASQLGMLWHEQLAPGSFNLPCLVRRYRGRLDQGALERALGELVIRHEPLRTTFELVRGRPRQAVGSVLPFHLPVTDLGDLPPQERDSRAARLVAEASGRPFDLVTGPLFAPSLVRLGTDDHFLIVRLHHTAFDDWSVDVYRHQLSALYTAFAAGGAPPLPEPATRFADVASRQQARIEGAAGDEERAFWRARMAGAPLPVQVPLGRPGPGEAGAGEPLRHDIGAGLAQRVRDLAPHLRATPFMTVLAAFEVLLAQRMGQHDLVVATVVGGRNATAHEPVIGCFTKKVLLRLRVDADPTFAELVARTRANVLEAVAHQHLPFEAVVQETIGRPAAEHGLATQVPVVFQGETPQQARIVMPGLEVGPFEVPAAARRERHFSAGGAAAAEETAAPWGDGAYLGTFLLLSLLESDGLALVARGVFGRAEAGRLLEDLERVLDAATRSPDQRLSMLGLLQPLMRPAVGGDELHWRGLTLRRSRLEAALATCPGVAELAVTVDGPAGEPRLVAHVVADRTPPPTLAQLRAALWRALPGSPWPAAAVVVDALPRLADGQLDETALLPAPPQPDEPPDPRATLLTALWAEASGRKVTPATSYWQDFSFLPALAEARAAGLPITDEQVARCRTPEMLAAALAAADATPPSPTSPL